MDPNTHENDMNDTQSLITAYALGELEGTDLARVEKLIADDPTLKAEVNEIRKVAQQLEEALTAEGSSAAGLEPAQREAIHAKAQATHENEPLPGSQRLRWTRWTLYGGLSAVAALLIIGLLLPPLGAARRSSRSLQPNSGNVAMVKPSNSSRVETSGKDRADRLEEQVAQDQTISPITKSKRSDMKMDGGKAALGLTAVPPHSPITQRQMAAAKGMTSPAPMSSKPASGTKLLTLPQSHTSSDSAQLAMRRQRMPMPMPMPTRPSEEGKRGFHTEAYDAITDNPFLKVAQNPLSTFSIDVDTASYANIRRFLTQGQLPPPGAVRIEEMVNYFPYDYSPPADDKPFAVHVEVGSTPWAQTHRLVKIGIKGKVIAQENKPQTNLVFLIDVSGSMLSQNKLPLLKAGMKMLVKQMTTKDHVAIVVYAGAAGMVLDTTPGSEEGQATILAAIDHLQAGGSTNGGAGIRLAYDLAQRHFIKEGVNRVILASDGDFNVGTTTQDELVRLIEDKRKTGVFFTVLGFGQGNFKDSTMEKLADKGNGSYAYIDTIKEAKKVLVEQAAGTLYTIAKDVKIQVEFNPAQVQSYRLIGYENRLLAKEDFNDDTKDAGEIGAGHTVTALYEVVPTGVKDDTSVPPVDPLKYQSKPGQAGVVESKTTEGDKPAVGPVSKELLTVKIRYKQPDGDVSTKMAVPVTDTHKSWQDTSADFRFAAGVAQFGMLLRHSPYKGGSTFAQVLDLAQSGLGKDKQGYRQEFITLVQKARQLTPPGNKPPEATPEVSSGNHPEK